MTLARKNISVDYAERLRGASSNLTEAVLDMLSDGDVALKRSGRRVCVSCGEKPWYLKTSEARSEGHIYSEEGMREFEISQMCEFCFDEVTYTDY